MDYSRTRVHIADDGLLKFPSGNAACVFFCFMFIDTKFYYLMYTVMFVISLCRGYTL